MYHFVKFNNTWYLKPETIQDVIDHFNKICGREFKEGFDDFNNNVEIHVSSVDGHKYLYSKNHSSSVWRNVVELCEMNIKGLSWLEGACSLEKQTFEDRIKRFLEGKPMFFTDGLAYFPPKEWPIYDEEKWSETLEYPYDYQYENCRFLQWPGGRHWYVKIGSIDIGDKYGNYKFSDKSYAQKVAKQWCQCGGDWDKYITAIEGEENAKYWKRVRESKNK